MKYNSIIKHIKIFFDDVKGKGLYIAFVNISWFIRKLFPENFFMMMMKKKHLMVKKKICEVIGNVDKYPLPQLKTKRSFNSTPLWFCWLQGEKNMPPITQICLKSINANSNGHPVIFISLDNYKKYVTLPAHIAELFLSKKIKYAHFADILRTALLYTYGGGWIDSTILLTRPLSTDIFRSEFYSIKLPVDYFFISQARWSNFFLFCHSGNKLMGRTLELFYRYLSQKDYFIDYFMMDYFMDIVLETDITLMSQIDSIPYNNQNVHQLKFHLEDNYSINHFADICGNTYIHKLNWRVDSQNHSYNSVYNYLLKLYK